MRRYCVYILASRSRRLYIGVTSRLDHRLRQHRADRTGFAGRYACDRLVLVEMANSAVAAITREKQLKGWRRARKLALIESVNPAWDDLSGGQGYEKVRILRCAQDDGEGRSG